MTQQRRTGAAGRSMQRERAPRDDSYERHGPEPPENDSGPSPSTEEMDRYSDVSIPRPHGDEQAGRS